MGFHQQPLSDVTVPVPPGTADLATGNTSVRWKVTPGNHLQAVLLDFTGADVRYNENGAILPTYPELEEEAYRIANYVADRIFLQIGVDAIDPDHVLSEVPTISPENPKEELEFKTKKRSTAKVSKFRYAIHGKFEPVAYTQGFHHSAAHGYYADALRAASAFREDMWQYEKLS